MEALGFKTTGEQRRQRALDRREFLVRLEEKRHAEHVKRVVDFGQSGDGERRRLQSVDGRIHLGNGGRLAGDAAARENRQNDTA